MADPTRPEQQKIDPDPSQIRKLRRMGIHGNRDQNVESESFSTIS